MNHFTMNIRIRKFQHMPGWFRRLFTVPVTETSPYSFYQPLDTSRGEIRLIKIIPALNNDETIQCTLETALLSTSGLTHAALSYVWGDPEITRDIHVNGKPFPITENLYDALWHFRSNSALLSDGRNSELPLWVDAICINQGDTNERNQQVPFMSSIYSSATRVISWVGTPGVDGGDIAIRMTRNIVKKVFDDVTGEINEKSLRNILISHPLLFRKDKEKVVLNDYEGNVAWKTINRLYQRPYWRRIWIFQEIILAGHASTHLLVCGHEAMAFNDAIKLCRIFRFLQRNNVPEQLGLDQEVWDFVKHDTTLNIFMAIDWWRGVSAGGQRTLRLDLLLFMSLMFQATDPRDYVYGFHALTVLKQRVDYNKSKKEVYLDWYNNGIGTIAGYEGHMPPILLAGLGLDETWEPSWLPNLSRLYEIFRKSYLGNLLDGWAEYNLINPIYSRPGDITSKVSGDSLYISGVRCGKITEVFRINASAPRHRQLHYLCFDVLTRENQIDHPCGISALQALFYLIHQGHDPRTAQRLSVPLKPTSAFQAFRWYGCVNTKFGLDAAFANEEIEYERCAAEYGPKWKQGKFSSYRELIRHLDKSICEGMMGQGDFQTLKQSDPVGTVTANTQWAGLEASGFGKFGRSKFGLPDTIAIIHSTREKVVFQTDKGHIGFGLKGLREGDQVCTLETVPSPMVLRETGKRHRNVGLCYVYGLWDDGAEGTIKPGDPRLEEFEIY
ncbi:heterokaryon incompatibility protein-domain-containing protein [Hypoxylon rubiginosum]|uniref:Heterokaryon incompatibility protein-domain-containing protein n=1 Tax=Hypoxylon rubiginosum TaxID=110542 RepID=A0ACC0DAG6_9PEZI|nr:heterokaryon incompatibility protein-domain-containing protein [Hypoxylon rubiginosum]